jgi:hypothetical protein
VAFVHDGHATLKRVKSGKAVIVNRPYSRCPRIPSLAS